MHRYNFGHFGLNIMWPDLAKDMIDTDTFLRIKSNQGYYVNSKVFYNNN